MPVQIKQPHIQKHIFYLIDNAPNNGQVISKAGPYTGKIGLIEWSALQSSKISCGPGAAGWNLDINSGGRTSSGSA